MSQLDVVRKILSEVVAFLRPQLDLANAHMVDFFTKSTYSKFVPKTIQSEVDLVGFDDFLTSLLTTCNEEKFDKIPETKKFVETCRKLTLKNCPDVCLDVETFLDQLNRWGCTEIDKFKLEVFITPKKSHEVEILSAISASIAKISNVSHLVDIGDGKGYLSSMLALHHKIPVLGIDSCNTNTEGAVKRVKKLSKVWNGFKDHPHKSCPSHKDNAGHTSQHLYQQITKYVTDQDDLLSLIKESFPDDVVSSLGLVGLHTCGDLATNSLKVYTKTDHIKSICNVGCCYHLLTENQEGGFPLCHFLADQNITIGRSGRMIANQSIDRIVANKEHPNTSIYYRALLQIVLKRQYPELPSDCHVGRFRKPCDNFVDYARKAFKRLNIEHSLITDDELIDLHRIHDEFRNQINIFFMLRCHLSPVIESIIILDRLCFLLENNFDQSYVVRLFDPVISPRCYGLLSIKHPVTVETTLL